MAHMEKHRPLFRIFENGFTEDDINNIPIPGTIENAQIIAEGQGRDVMNTKVRRSQTAWIFNQHLLMFLHKFADQANVQTFNVDMNMVADIQYTVYEASENGHYDWHIDTAFMDNRPTDRKLSVTVQLTDGSEYEGGDFEIEGVNMPTHILKKKGTVLVFPSYLKHRVTPVTRGTRKSLVAWFEGPHWR